MVRAARFACNTLRESTSWLGMPLSFLRLVIGSPGRNLGVQALYPDYNVSVLHDTRARRFSRQGMPEKIHI